jgi:cystathionine beta-lyase/cystathionine gamma-synthase
MKHKTMKALKNARPRTVAVGCHHNQANLGKLTPLVTPVYNSVTYTFESLDQYQDSIWGSKDRYIYTRISNPTVQVAEKTICQLEGGFGTLLYCSGMQASLGVFMSMLKAGDHVVAQNLVYHGTEDIIRRLPTYGIQVSRVNVDCSINEWQMMIQPNTKLLWAEALTNPTLAVLDLAAYGKLGCEMGVTTAVDATFTSTALQQPLSRGVDIVMHSCTKYHGGHSDVLAGCVTAKSEKVFKRLKSWHLDTGPALSAAGASNLLRGLQTLHIRVKQQCESAALIAAFLETCPHVKSVRYPGLKSHPNHDIAKRELKGGFGAMIAFEMHSYKAAAAVFNNTELISAATSLGAVETLVEHQYSKLIPPDSFDDGVHPHVLPGITPSLLRLSIGLEDPLDLIEDLKKSMKGMTFEEAIPTKLISTKRSPMLIEEKPKKELVINKLSEVVARL